LSVVGVRSLSSPSPPPCARRPSRSPARHPEAAAGPGRHRHLDHGGVNDGTTYIIESDGATWTAQRSK
jgi:hypothetical protein